MSRLKWERKTKETERLAPYGFALLGPFDPRKYPKKSCRKRQPSVAQRVYEVCAWLDAQTES